MEWGTLPGWITAFATLLTAGGGLLLAIKTVIPTHRIVNSQRTDMQRYIKVLENFVTSQGYELPEDQSKLDE